MPNEPQEPVLSVSDLNRQARVTIEQEFPSVWVMGELSNLAKPRSGHWYFSLKDESAQVRCAMFANRNRAVQVSPTDGQQVLLRGRVSLYEGRGEFQIIVDYMEPAGEGALRQAFEKLKAKLSQEGLFHSAEKLPLPDFPKHVAVITSPSGAAIKDVLAVWQRRYPILDVTIIPTLVQGQEAEFSLLRALDRAQAVRPDVLLITRGGGSLEDLWCFNSEPLARAIHACDIPVVSAVGHEIDVTICDFVADVRAATPSAGAEIIVPSALELSQELQSAEHYLAASMTRIIEHLELTVSNAQLRVPHPQAVLERMAQRVDDAQNRLQRVLSDNLASQDQRLRELSMRLPLIGPRAELSRLTGHIVMLRKSLASGMQQKLMTSVSLQQQLTRMLHNLSPLPTLARGFAIIKDDQGFVVSDAKQLAKDAVIEAYLANGSIKASVTEVSEKTIENPESGELE